MLKKDPPPWSKTQTMVVRVLKEKLQQLPPLQIPLDGKRILQTDASDKYWGAILFEERDGKRHICGSKSERFSEAEIHYHSTFKEILAVKKGINKFKFHLIGYHSLVEMDMSSFPQMLKFKQKIIPNPQLLRWAEWFSKYSFDCKHIKGKSNTLADFLTRPNSISKAHNQKIMMFRPSSSKPSKKNKSTQEIAFNIPPNLNPDFPPEVYRLVLENQFHPRARAMIFEYQLNLFQEFGGLMLKHFGLHPDYPFIHPIFFEFTEIPDELKWLLWYFTHCYHIAIQFVLEDLQYFIDQALNKIMEPHLQNFITIFQWFYPLHQWKEMINKESENRWEHFPLHGHRILPEDVRRLRPQYREIQRYLCQINSQIPREIWPPPDTDAPWDAWPSDPTLLTPYHRSIMEVLQAYKDKILNPSEWSQSYPWEISSASKIAESSTTAKEEYDKTVRSLKRMQDEKMDPEEKFEALQLEIWRRKRHKEERIIKLNITDDESTYYEDLL
ncbi:hypothetical protein V6N12_012193 [Hibiscus sabdariffa]|uniref:Reverse transcriptase RNase H-like domain-containing protein n=1 Tax=Hibiscus sabdariffa TaxID=183260 RepID=A0ABR2CHE1_9ROSI